MRIKISNRNRLWPASTSLQLLNFLNKIAATTMAEVFDRLEHRSAGRTWTDWVRSATSLLHLSNLHELICVYLFGPFSLPYRVALKNLRLWLFDFSFFLISWFSTSLTGCTIKATLQTFKVLILIVDVEKIILSISFLKSFKHSTLMLTWLKFVWELYLVDAF